MKLLDALRQVRVLSTSRQRSRLIQLLSAVLDAVQFDSELHARLLEVSVGPDAHLLVRSHGRTRHTVVEFGAACGLLVHRHGLVNIRLHQLVLLICLACHAFATSALSRVSNSFDSLTLTGSAWLGHLSRPVWCVPLRIARVAVLASGDGFALGSVLVQLKLGAGCAGTSSILVGLADGAALDGAAGTSVARLLALVC